MVPILTHRLLMIGCDSIVPPVTLDAMDAITSADRGGMGDGNKTARRAEWKREKERERERERQRERRKRKKKDRAKRGDFVIAYFLLRCH